MKETYYLLSLFCCNMLFSQNIQVPTGIVYKYASENVNTEAKKIIQQEISSNKKYSMYETILLIGPNLWKRYKDVKKVKDIEAGNLELHVPVFDTLGRQKGMEIEVGKVIQDKKDFKVLWDYFTTECAGKVTFRKLKPEELKYYWSVISFDIEEPIFILETTQHKYIVDINANGKLLWLDEF